MTDMLDKVEHEVRILRAQLTQAEEALLAYVRGGGIDPEVYERLDRNIERLCIQLESSESRELALRGEGLVCMPR